MQVPSISPPAIPSRPLLSLSALALAALTLAGCAQFSDLGPRAEPKAAEAYQASQTLAGSAVAWPDDNWWTAYGDQQLNTLIGEALHGAPSLAVARARLLKAEGAAQQQGAALLPQDRKSTRLNSSH